MDASKPFKIKLTKIIITLTTCTLNNNSIAWFVPNGFKRFEIRRFTMFESDAEIFNSF